jgi:hypothetical protein
LTFISPTARSAVSSPRAARVPPKILRAVGVTDRNPPLPHPDNRAVT